MIHFLLKWPIFKDKLVVCFSCGYLLMLQDSGEAPRPDQTSRVSKKTAPEAASVGASLRWVLTVTPPRRHLVAPTPIKLHGGWPEAANLQPTGSLQPMWKKDGMLQESHFWTNLTIWVSVGRFFFGLEKINTYIPRSSNRCWMDDKGCRKNPKNTIP